MNAAVVTSRVEHERYRLQAPSARRLRIAFWILAAGLAFLQAWGERGRIENDGVTFVELGEAALRGDWKEAINGIYQPLWGLILAVTLRVVRPAPCWQFFTMHMVNLAVMFGALAAFDYLLRGLIVWQREARSEPEGLLRIADTSWVLYGYAACLWAFLDLVGLGETNPDLAICAVVFWACGLLVRIRLDGQLRSMVLLGLVMALGYWIKSVFLLMAPVFLASAALALPGPTRRLRSFLLGALVFVVVAAPPVALLSRSLGRLSWGESGRLNYAWYVAGVPSRHFQGQTPGAPPQVRSRQLLAAPPTYEFGGPLTETYPLWYDISRYYEGVNPSFRLGAQLKKVWSSSLEAEQLIFGLHGAFAVGLVMLAVLSFGTFGTSRLRNWLDLWFLVLPVCVGAGLYLAVHVENRYLAPFAVPLLLAILATVPIPESAASARPVQALGVAMTVFLLWPGGPVSQPRNYRVLARWAMGRDLGPGNEYCRVAEGLEELGLHRGDRVATLEHGNTPHVLWARLGGFQIAAEVYLWIPGPRPETDYWNYDGNVRRHVLESLASTGSRFVVSARPPRDETGGAWRRIEQTSFYALNLGPYGAGAATP